MNKGPSSETASNHSSNSHDSAVDFFTKFNIHGGWKSLLLYQFELQFSFLIMLSVVISYSAVLLDAAFALGVYRVRWIEKTYDRFSIHLLYGFDLAYFTDLISMTIYKNLDWTDIKYRHKSRNSFLIFIEFLTLIPLDGIYYTLTKPNMRVLYMLRLRYALRAFRLMGFYRSGKNYVGARSHILQLCIIIFYVILFVITASAIAYVYSCYTMRMRCTFNNSPYFTHLFYTCVSSVVMLGQATDSAFKEFTLVGLLFYLSLVAYVCNVHLISQFICDVTFVFMSSNSATARQR
ncbi:hypothetical protein QE152_g7567 [Popillia japonica]|uniref:Ion transport domain-containing protein n=1 Tax=Popillia japonica TaxID=7064 RepID=A0AAW1MED0_POPJA